MGGVAVATLATWLLVRSLQRSSEPLPPGPPKRPFVGNIMLMDPEKGWETFHQWSKELNSPLVSLTGLGHTIIITNSFDSAKTILERSLASDRPQLMTMNELVGWKNSLIFSPFNDVWKRQRRLFHQVIGTRSSLTKYDAMKEVVAAKFVANLMEEPVKLEEHCHTFAGDLILRVTYGYVSKGYDPMIKMAEEITDAASEFGAPGKWLVDIFPVLRYVPDWFPGTGWKQAVKEQHDNVQKLINTPYEWVKQEMDEGRAGPSFASELLSEKNLSEEELFAIKWSAGSLFAGGAHTTVWAVYAFMKMVCLHPDIQDRVQAELDSVVGSDRLPLVTDMDDCPYTWACCLEVLRWHVVLPLAVPQLAMEDSFHEGYLIPKGAIIISNLWAIARDEVVYPEPYTFKPERYLGDNPQRSPQDWVFGFGRRSCPGRLMALESMFTVCATTLATMRISQKVRDGIPVPIDATQTAGLASRPTPFEYEIKPRSEQAKALVYNAVLAQ
ncbi:cytochrome P450 [Schizophyllum commune]